mgnify:CR=1 FL=1
MALFAYPASSIVLMTLQGRLNYRFLLLHGVGAKSIVPFALFDKAIILIVNEVFEEFPCKK